MRKRSIPRPVAVPPLSYAPDGLTEADVDALLAEMDADVASPRPRPGWLPADPTEHRRNRHRARQATRLLAANWLVGGMQSQGKSNATHLISLDLVTGPDWDEVA